MPLISIPVKGPFDRIDIDVLGPFPKSQRDNKYIVVVSDYFTKYPEAFAVPNQQATTIAKLLVGVICKHGCPSKILTDRGANFTCELIKELCWLLDIQKVLQPVITLNRMA